MNWTNRKVFVTGADGFIGGCLAKKLVDIGADVVVIARDHKRYSAINLHGIRDKVTLVDAKLENYESMLRLINEYEIENIYHLAAQAIVGISNRSTLSTYEANVKGTWCLMEAARVAGVTKGIVVASSDKAYGVQPNLPYTEDQPLLGLYPYDASKACADIISRSYAVSFGLPVVVTRNANTYGGGDMNFSRIIPDAICAALQDRELIIRSDGTLERDYMYIDDAVESYLRLMDKLIEDPSISGEAYNFGTSKPISVLEVFETVAKLTGTSKKPKIMGKATNEINCQYLATDKVAQLLQWAPQYDLEAGITKTIAWYKDFLEKYPDAVG